MQMQEEKNEFQVHILVRRTCSGKRGQWGPRVVGFVKVEADKLGSTCRTGQSGPSWRLLSEGRVLFFYANVFSRDNDWLPANQAIFTVVHATFLAPSSYTRLFCLYFMPFFLGLVIFVPSLWKIPPSRESS